MPRPPRCRRICGVPQVDTFCPSRCEDTEPILLTLDEYEVIRLVDLERQTHEQCAAQMDISRSTVQEIYESARRKIAACLVHGNRCKCKQFLIIVDTVSIFLCKIILCKKCFCHNNNCY